MPSHTCRYQSRRWAFTLFTDLEHPPVYRPPKNTYLICGAETCPKTGKFHWQCYAEFNIKVTRSQLQNKLCRKVLVHCEGAKGSPEDNYNYCRKLKEDKPNEVWFEYGERMEWNVGKGKRTDLETVRDAIVDGASYHEILFEYPSVGARCPNWVREICRMTEEERNWVTEVHILWGPTGSGKTRYCVEQGAVRIGYNGKFYTGYEGEPVVRFDEIPLRKWPREELLELLDRYPYQIEVKGGFRNWCPKVIYFTTNEDPNPYLEAEPAIKRRITSVKFMSD